MALLTFAASTYVTCNIQCQDRVEARSLQSCYLLSCATQLQNSSMPKHMRLNRVACAIETACYILYYSPHLYRAFETDSQFNHLVKERDVDVKVGSTTRCGNYLPHLSQNIVLTFDFQFESIASGGVQPLHTFVPVSSNAVQDRSAPSETNAIQIKCS